MTLPLSDLVLAALALTTGMEVFTLDNHFRKVPGVRLFDPRVFSR
jgi:predicted nucleic acid-binding protein